MDVPKSKSLNQARQADTLKQATLYMLFSRIGMMALAFITHVINTRLLGPELFGVFILCSSTVTLMGSIETGLSSALTKYLSEFQALKERAKSYSAFRTSFILESSLAILFILVFVPVAYSKGFLGTYSYALPFIVLILVVSTCNGFFGSAMIALKRLRVVSLLQFGQSILYLVLVASVAHFFDYTLFVALSALVLPAVIGAAIFLGVIKGLSKGCFERTPEMMFRPMLGFAIPVAIAAFISNAITSGGPIILKLLGQDFVQLGYFGVLLSLGNRGRGVMLSVYKSVFPYVSSWYAKDDKERIARVIVFITLAILLLMVLLALFLAAVGESLICLIYGPEYLVVSKSLVLACLVFLVASLRDFTSVVLNSIGKPTKDLMGGSIAFCVFMATLVSTASATNLIDALLFSIGIAYGFFNSYALVILAREFPITKWLLIQRASER